MEKILELGCCNVFIFVRKFLTVVGVLYSSLVFCAENGGNPFSCTPVSAEASQSTYNPYQVIYDAYVKGMELNEKEIELVEKCFITDNINEKIGKIKKNQKSFLWLIVSTLKKDPDYFIAKDTYGYEAESKQQGIEWKSDLVFVPDNSLNNLFRSLLVLDFYQDMEIPDGFLKKLTELCMDEKIGVYLNNWRLAIQEEDIKIFTRNTLLEATSKNWGIEPSERFLPLTKSLVYVILGTIGFGFAVKSSSSNTGLVITTFVGLAIGYCIDVWLSQSHTMLYYFLKIRESLDIENLDMSIIDTVYEKSIEIRDLDSRKSFIKSMGAYVSEKLRKTWTLSGFKEEFEEVLNEKVHLFE